MKICPECKSPLADSIKVCPYCDMIQPEAAQAPVEPAPAEAPVPAEEPVLAEETAQAAEPIPAEAPVPAEAPIRTETPEEAQGAPFEAPATQPAAPAVPVGTAAEPVPAVPARPAAETPEERALAKTSMILGIISLAVGGIAGIILGAIGLKKSNQYVATRIRAHGMALAGRILSRLGLIFGIVSAVIIFIYVVYMLLFCFIMIRYNAGAFEDLFNSFPRY